LIIIIITIIIYTVFLFFSDFSKIYDHLETFNTIYLIPIFLLVLLSWCVLFLRWTLLLKNLNISIPYKSSFIIFLSSFALSATPGQLGELIKSKLLKNKFDIPISKTAPLIFIERIYDLIGALIVSSLGISYIESGNTILLIFTIILFSLIILLRSKIVFTKFLSLFEKIKFLRNKITSISDVYESIQPSLNPKIFLSSTLLSMIYWMLVGTSSYFVLLALEINTINYFHMISIYSSSIIIGAVSLIPGGVGVAEGSITGLLSLGGVEISIAFVIGILVRVFTLWYGVIIGFILLKLNGGINDS
jgi:glycosyltransferase 2 family protein